MCLAICDSFSDPLLGWLGSVEQPARSCGGQLIPAVWQSTIDQRLRDGKRRQAALVVGLPTFKAEILKMSLPRSPCETPIGAQNVGHERLSDFAAGAPMNKITR
jgi:hypothetical protein